MNMKEFSERDIELWSKASEHNRRAYESYINEKKKCNKAWEDRDGAAYTGRAVRRDAIRYYITQRIVSENH